ncbi:MAG: glycoside hydrolase family 9 protein, partial [Cyclobacteriaceae bacterium]|nr:glycoside hydrolase family 9 protein [Cyclobacteriaceae bacterium]
NKGIVEWRYKTDLRLIYPAAIVDIENDGKTDILVCGSDRKLRCFTLNGKYNPRKIPWSSHRFDAAKTGSSFNKRGKQSIRITDKIELLLFGDFERTKIVEAKSKYPSGSINYETRIIRPREWFAEIYSNTDWQLDSLNKHSGHSAVKITTKDKRFLLGSTGIEVDNSLKNIDVSIWFKGKTTPTAEIIWKGVNGIIRVDQLQTHKRNNSGWVQLSKDGLVPPNSASWFKLVLGTDPSSVAWWDDAHIEGNFEVERKVTVYVNQLGFELSGQKFFTASSNYKSNSASFEIINQNNETVYSSSLVFRDRIKGAFGNDWGSYYWRGDFSQVNKPGHYRIKIILDGLEDISWPFEIADNLYWNKTVRLAYRFFYYQRCGMEIPGFHEACHLDDASDEKHEQFFDLSGGWHDAGDYNKYYNAPYVLGLANAYHIQQDLILSQEIDNDGTNEIL